jgi:RNA polymerase sigma-70 factor (ECF subfamily)
MDLSDTDWAAHRRYLFAVAYRMLGSATDAEDAVQDAYLRASTAGRDDVVDLRAYLTTIVARLCLDQLKSARVRRESYVGTWLPEPLVNYDDSDVADRIEVAEQLRLPAMLMLEQLSPAERVAFVLHDGFGMDYERLGLVLSRTPTACRQLVSRARRGLAGEVKSPKRSEPAEVERVIAAVLDASRTGDLEALVKLLHPDIVLRSDGGGVVRAARRPVVGAAAVARLLLGLTQLYPDLTPLPATVNGAPGAVLADGGPMTGVVAYEVGDGQVLSIDLVLAPDKLAWSRAQQTV